MPEAFDQRLLFRLSLLGLVFLFLPLAGTAQLANVDQVAEEFAKQLKSRKPHAVAVADLKPSGTALPEQGHFFSSFFSSALETYGKKLKILRHADFEADVKGISPDAFVSADAVLASQKSIPVDMLVIGTITRNMQAYSLTFSAIRVSNGQTLFSESTTFARTEFVDNLSEPFPPKFEKPIFETGRGAIAPPVCIYCPDPPYSDYARKKKVQAVSILNVLISPEGRVVRVQPKKMAGYGLDENAYESLKLWRFKPATNQEGTPVYVVVPVQVTFRLY